MLVHDNKCSTGLNTYSFNVALLEARLQATYIYCYLATSTSDTSDTSGKVVLFPGSRVIITDPYHTGMPL